MAPSVRFPLSPCGWLKDRRGRALSFEDIGHYQKIVKILSETDRIMKGIELPLD